MRRLRASAFPRHGRARARGGLVVTGVAQVCRGIAFVRREERVSSENDVWPVKALES